MSETRAAIEVRSVSKRFRRHRLGARQETIKGFFVGLWQGRLRLGGKPEYTEALRDLNFIVQRGQTFGIIGSNGSGKSTLLKLLAALMRPSTGEILVGGRVSALIELGAGFHPEISGRENVLMAGVMLGLTRRQVQERFDEIVAFAELEEFIDLPVKTYSSGMFMRLGFSVAIHASPDILLIDEVLAVGDEGFVQKCFEAISDFQYQGRTIVLVSHDLTTVERLCSQVAWLEQGGLRMIDHPRKVIDAYRSHVHDLQEERYERLHNRVEEARRRELETILEADGAPADELGEPLDTSAREEQDAETPVERWGTKALYFHTVRCLDSTGRERYSFETGEPLTLELTFVAREDLTDVAFGLGLSTRAGVVCFGTNTALEGIPLEVRRGVGKVCIEIPALNLVQGAYTLDIAAHTEDGVPYDYIRHLHTLSVHSRRGAIGIVDLSCAWSFQGAATSRSKKEPR
jgi:ABC-type polysaccharide/polyol phosphate transport system ATPase subunit